jgi:hypothetical protein
MSGSHQPSHTCPPRHEHDSYERTRLLSGGHHIHFVTALVVLSIALIGCGGKGEDATATAQMDRIHDCLQKAGIPTRQGTFHAESDAGGKQSAELIFAGPVSRPFVEIVALPAEILDTYYGTAQGKAELTNTKSEILGKNVLIRPISYGSKLSPPSSVPGIAHIEMCASTPPGRRSSP